MLQITVIPVISDTSWILHQTCVLPVPISLTVYRAMEVVFVWNVFRVTMKMGQEDALNVLKTVHTALMQLTVLNATIHFI